MIVYNSTIHINDAKAAAWLQWLTTTHAPEIMSTGLFTRFQVLRLLDVDESEGQTYAVQFFAETKAAYQQYTTKWADGFRQKAAAAWGDACVSFDTALEVVV